MIQLSGVYYPIQIEMFYSGVISEIQAGTSKFLPISQSRMHIYWGYLFLINSAKVDFPEFLTPNIIAEFLLYKILIGNYLNGYYVTEKVTYLFVVIKTC